MSLAQRDLASRPHIGPCNKNCAQCSTSPEREYKSSGTGVSLVAFCSSPEYVLIYLPRLLSCLKLTLIMEGIVYAITDTERPSTSTSAVLQPRGRNKFLNAEQHCQPSLFRV